MKNNLSLTVIFLLLVQTVFGQTFLKEFGKVGKAEIELTEYAKDKDAEAVVLFDIGKSYFVNNNNSYDVVFERTTRIKILSESGIKWAEVEIPIYQEGGIYETVSNVEACTYNYEDNLIKPTYLNVDNIYEEKINDYWKQKKFAMPNVKEGSIIEFKYKIESQYKFNLRDWEFQWKIPVVYSEYEVKMIPFYSYTYLLQGRSYFDYQNSHEDEGLMRQLGAIKFKDMVHKYVMKDLPAFNDEEFITSANDYIIKLDFQLSKINYTDGRTLDIMTTWEELVKEYSENKDFGKYVKSSQKLASKLIDQSSIAGKTVLQKFDFIIDMVKSDYKWNQDNGRFASKTPGKFVDDKYGNCADINLFAIGALRSAGIEAYPVLISTRNHGKIRYDYPFSHFFNYVLILAKIDGQNVLSDATDVLCLNERIPVRCINDKGLVVNEDHLEWVGLNCKFLSKVHTAIKMKIDDNNSINSEITAIATEYDALNRRNNFTDDVEKIKEKLEARNYDLNESSINVKNQNEKRKPYILMFSASSSPEIINDKVYIKPFLAEAVSDNPLKQQTRSYPIDMTYPQQRSFQSVIAIPENHTLDYSPSPLKINNNLIELNYSITTNDQDIIVQFDYSFKKPVYSADEYSKIKYFFNEIVKKGNEKIVFKKEI